MYKLDYTVRIFVFFFCPQGIVVKKVLSLLKSISSGNSTDGTKEESTFCLTKHRENASRAGKSAAKRLCKSCYGYRSYWLKDPPDVPVAWHEGIIPSFSLVPTTGFTSHKTRNTTRCPDNAICLFRSPSADDTTVPGCSTRSMALYGWRSSKTILTTLN